MHAPRTMQVKAVLIRALRKRATPLPNTVEIKPKSTPKGIPS
jgi:hypothetical protein